MLSTAGESVVVSWLGLMSTGALGGTGAAVSQLHCAVSAMGVFDSAGAVPLVVGSVPVLLGAGSVSTGAAVRTGAGVPLIADVTLAWAPVTTDFVSSTALRVSCSSAWMVRLNSSLNSLVARRKSLMALPTWPMISGSLAGPNTIKARTTISRISIGPMPRMFTRGLCRPHAPSVD